MMNIQRFAATTGKVVKTLNSIKALSSDLVAVNASDGISFDVKNYSNDRFLFVATNSNASAAKDVTIKAPTNGSYAATDTDLTLSVAASGYAVAHVETAKYANNDGTIIIKGGSADVKVVGVYLG